MVSYRIDRPEAEWLLVLAHGWSAEQHHLAAYVPLVDPDERYTATCPRAPHDLPDGDGASWYDITSAESVPAASFLAGLDAYTGVVDAEMERTGIAPDHTIVGGFSQGGFLALAAALRVGAPRFAGVWAMCCGLPPDIEGLDLDLSAASGGERPALIQVGERDQIVMPDRGRAAADALRGAGWNATVAGYDMAHSQTIEMMVDARTWLATV